MLLPRAIAVSSAFMTLAATARATPFFARAYNAPCSTCHSGFPRLNAFGRAFLENNFRMPGQDDGPRAWQHTIPLALKVEPTLQRLAPGGDTEQSTSTELMAGGLLARRTAFYMVHTFFEDAVPQPFPSEQLWVQQVLAGRSSLMLKAGQFELPYGYLPSVNPSSFDPLVFDAGLHDNDVPLGGQMSGLQISGLAANTVRWYVAGGAPAAASDAGNLVGERQFFGRFRDVFIRASSRNPSRGAGAFAYLAHPTRDPIDPTTGDTARRLGLEGAYGVRGTQLYGMAVYGEDRNPLGDGHKGVMRGAFIEADRMLRPWLGVMLRWEAQHLATSAGTQYSDAKTLSVRLYPARNVRWVAEQQFRDHGGSATAFFAAVTF